LRRGSETSGGGEEWRGGGRGGARGGPLHREQMQQTKKRVKQMGEGYNGTRRKTRGRVGEEKRGGRGETTQGKTRGVRGETRNDWGVKRKR